MACRRRTRSSSSRRGTASDGAASSSEVFRALSGALGASGLNVWLPLDAAAFDAACAPVAPALSLGSLLPGARAALVVGAGGRDYFAGFTAAPEATDGQPDPLDRYTRALVQRAARAALDPLGIVHVQLFPFVSESVVVPFQRLGRAAGLGGPGPLGLQIHPVFGAWWAYRGLIVLAADLPPAVGLSDGCAGCSAPCVAACPASAVQPSGFVVSACHARRLTAEPCRLSCAARHACIRGPEHRYSDAQLAFHMSASMPRRL